MSSFDHDGAVSFITGMKKFTPPKADECLGGDFFQLNAIRMLLSELSDPQKAIGIVHIAGTNGKGSVSAYLDSVLRAAGVRTGRFNSPNILSYNDMISIGGNIISDEAFADSFNEVYPAVERLNEKKVYPSEFEILTAMAFVAFIKAGCDIAIVECGLGGRTDATNVIPAPLVTVITPISFDHMTILGNSLGDIAREKAGIIKPQTVVVSARQEAEAACVIEGVCEKNGVDIIYAPQTVTVDRSLKGQRFTTTDNDRIYENRLLGVYQNENAALAIAAARKLGSMGYDISEEDIEEGIASTEWFGRFTVINDAFPVIIDGGHNRQGAYALRDSLLTYFPDRRITFVIGMLADKEVDEILDIILPLAGECYTVSVKSERTMNAEALSQRIKSRGVKAMELSDIGDIIRYTDKSEIICIFGSLYLLKSIDTDLLRKRA